MQIRLTKPNEKRLLELMKRYRKKCVDYNLSPTGQVNQLLQIYLSAALEKPEEKTDCNSQCPSN